MSAALGLSDNKLKVMIRFKLFAFLAITIAAAGCVDNSKQVNQNNNSLVSAATSAPTNAVVVSSNVSTGTQTTAPTTVTEVPTFDNANTALDEGKKFFVADEDEKAVKAFEQAVKLDPNLPEAHFQLALAYDAVANQESAEKSYNAAIKAYLKFLAKNPKDATAQFNLGRSYNKINEDEKAQKALLQAVKINPDESEYHLELGNVLIKLAKYPEAVKELKKSLELEPENARAEVALEKAESGDNRVKAAQAKNKDARKDIPTPPTKNSPPIVKSNKNDNIPPEKTVKPVNANVNQ